MRGRRFNFVVVPNKRSSNSNRAPQTRAKEGRSVCCCDSSLRKKIWYISELKKVVHLFCTYKQRKRKREEEMKYVTFGKWTNEYLFPMTSRERQVTSQSTFHCFSKISLLGVTSNVDLGKNIWNVKGSRNIRLKPAVRAIRLGVLSKFQVRSRIRIQSPTGCWLVETGVRVHQTSNGPAWSFDQAVIPTRLLSRFERDSRSTLNGSGAKKLIIVPSTMAWYQFAFGI